MHKLRLHASAAYLLQLSSHIHLERNHLLIPDCHLLPWIWSSFLKNSHQTITIFHNFFPCQYHFSQLNLIRNQNYHSYSVDKHNKLKDITNIGSQISKYLSQPLGQWLIAPLFSKTSRKNSTKPSNVRFVDYRTLTSFRLSLNDLFERLFISMETWYSYTYSVNPYIHLLPLTSSASDPSSISSQNFQNKSLSMLKICKTKSKQKDHKTEKHNIFSPILPRKCS